MGEEICLKRVGWVLPEMRLPQASFTGYVSEKERGYAPGPGAQNTVYTNVQTRNSRSLARMKLAVKSLDIITVNMDSRQSMLVLNASLRHCPHPQPALPACLGRIEVQASCYTTTTTARWLCKRLGCPVCVEPRLPCASWRFTGSMATTWGVNL